MHGKFESFLVFPIKTTKFVAAERMLFRKTFPCVRLMLKNLSKVLSWIMLFDINLDNTPKEVDFVFFSS